MYVVFDIKIKSGGSARDLQSRWPSFRNLLISIYNWAELPLTFDQNQGEISGHSYDSDDDLICPSANIDSRNQDLKFLKEDLCLKITINASSYSDFYTIELLSPNSDENIKFLFSTHRSDFTVKLNNQNYQKWVDMLYEWKSPAGNRLGTVENVTMGPIIMQNKIGCTDEAIVWKWFRAQLIKIYQLSDLAEIMPFQEKMVKYKELYSSGNHKIAGSINFDFSKKKDINIYYDGGIENEKVSTLVWPEYIVLRVYSDNPYKAVWMEALEKFNPEDWA